MPSFTQRYGASYTPALASPRRWISPQHHALDERRHFRDGRHTTATQSTKAISTTNRASGASLTLTYSPFSIATLTASYRISDSGSGGYGGYGGYGMNYGNSYYSSAYTSGSYMNSGNYSFGNQYTGSYYSPGSSYSPYTSGYGPSYSDYTSPLSGMPTIRSHHSDRAHAVSGRQEGDGDTDGGDPEPGGGDTDGSTDTTSTRIRSINRSIGLQLTPMDRLNLSINYSNDLQEANPPAATAALPTWASGSPTALGDPDAQWSGHRQRYTFLGAAAAARATSASWGLRWGPSTASRSTRTTRR